ncbi:MAG: hypothetical protein HN590_10670, partial [Calditrichaeota bacterium]|nr:hypothetical protein [Calditrichota bacterium]
MKNRFSLIAIALVFVIGFCPLVNATIGIFESEVFSINTDWEINQPELLIQAEDDIRFSAREDGSYLVRIAVTNHGIAVEDNITVHVFARDLDNQDAEENQIGEVVLEGIQADARGNVELEWEPGSPNQLVRVIIDPDEEIDEYIEGNNTRTKNFGAGGDQSCPEITHVEAQYDGIEAENRVGYFISGVEGALNTFEIFFVEPANIARIDYEINGNEGRIEEPDENERWTIEYDMGLIGFEGTELTVRAVSYSDFTSEEYIIEIVMLALPDWYIGLVGEQIGAQAIAFNDGFYEIIYSLDQQEDDAGFGFNFEFDETDNEGNDILFLGGTSIDITPEMDIGFGYNIFEGAADFHFRGDWEEINLFNGPFQVGANGGFDVDGSVNNDLSFRQASGMIRLHIGLDFPTIRTYYPLVPGLTAILEITARIWGDLLGQVTLGQGENGALEFINETNFQTQINVGATIAAKLELGPFGLAFAGTPTIYARIEVQYTTADGKTFEYAFGVEIPWEVYSYLGIFGHEFGRLPFADGVFGPWEWPRQNALFPDRDDLMIN